ncbi:MAG: peptide deformylase [Vulcanimicrobiota bacterium]
MQIQTLQRPANLSLVPRRAPVLHQPAAPVDQIDASVREALQDMKALMREKGGCGLAGPQVGIPSQLIVVDGGQGPVGMVNPKIVSRSGGTPSLEGCLSLPGSMSLVWRSSRVTVEGLDQNGQFLRKDCQGLEARCYQHEIDHLKGTLISDRAVLTVTPGRVLGAAVGGIGGAMWQGLNGGIIGGILGVATAWTLERLARPA